MQSQGVFNEYWTHIGPVPVSGTVITTWVLMLVIFLCAFISTRRLKLQPSTFQAMVEGIVQAIESVSK